MKKGIWIILIIVIIFSQITLGMNATTENFILLKAQRSVFGSNFSSQNLKIEIYNPEQLTLNQSSNNFQICHGYFCIGKAIVTMVKEEKLPSGAILRCNPGYILTALGQQYLCLPKTQIQEYIQQEDEKLILILITTITLGYFLIKRRKKKKDDKESWHQKMVEAKQKSGGEL